MASPIFFIDKERLVDCARKHRMAIMFGVREMTEAGGLMSYGISLDGTMRRAAEYMDRIARGARPAELPVKQPTKFELVINLKTAETLGVTIPRSLLARADEVIVVKPTGTGCRTPKGWGKAGLRDLPAWAGVLVRGKGAVVGMAKRLGFLPCPRKPSVQPSAAAAPRLSLRVINGGMILPAAPRLKHKSKIKKAARKRAPP